MFCTSLKSLFFSCYTLYFFNKGMAGTFLCVLVEERIGHFESYTTQFEMYTQLTIQRRQKCSFLTCFRVEIDITYQFFSSAQKQVRNDHFLPLLGPKRIFFTRFSFLTCFRIEMDI